jgi:hypothetical protein
VLIDMSTFSLCIIITTDMYILIIFLLSNWKTFHCFWKSLITCKYQVRQIFYLIFVFFLRWTTLCVCVCVCDTGGFELRASGLLCRCSITWTTLPALFCVG